MAQAASGDIAGRRHHRTGQPAKVLTIAGSDSGGAAGLQADLKTFTMLRVYGMSVVTAVTAQNSVQVSALHSLPADFVSDQLEAVLSDYGAYAVKTGFLGDPDVVAVVAEKLADYGPPLLVVDPVLVNHHGESMFSQAVTRAYLDLLIPMADLVTPNCREAEMLSGQAVTDAEQAEAAARAIHSKEDGWVLVTGCSQAGDSVDLLSGEGQLFRLRSPRVETEHTHGSGDTLSAAAAAYLARGDEMVTAVTRAHHFTARAIRGGAGWQMGAGHGPVSVWGDEWVEPPAPAEEM